MLLVACVLLLSSGFCADAAPLQVLSTNPRYFTDGSGKAVYLAGNHRSNHVAAQAGGIVVEFSAQHQQNYIRLWVWETEKLPWGSAAPGPFARPGPGTASDGGPKFDLDQWNPAFFDNLRGVVMQARDRGIYVSVMLFQGFSIVQKGAFGNHWDWHPFHRKNNVNRINGDLNGNGEGEETHTLADARIVQIQQAYVRKVVDTLNDLDNVLFEISNEDPWSLENTSWQYAMTRYIQDYEAGRIDGIVRNQHPVGITGGGPTDEELLASPADWISPISKQYQDDPPAATGDKVILIDTDHIWGKGGTRDWVWRSFLRGVHPVQLLDNDPPDLHPYERELAPALGHTVSYAGRMNLAAMAPRGDLTSTAYCLASPGSEYLVYQPGSGAFTLRLEQGTYLFEWFDVERGLVVQTGAFSASSENLGMTPPISGPVVLYLKSWPGDQPLATLTTLSASPATIVAGGTLTATWSGLAVPTPADWIGLYMPGTGDAAFIARIYVSCSQSPVLARSAGSCFFGLPSDLPSGSYELRVFSNNGFTRLGTSNGLNVTPRQSVPPSGAPGEP